MLTFEWILVSYQVTLAHFLPISVHIRICINKMPWLNPSHSHINNLKRRLCLKYQTSTCTKTQDSIEKFIKWAWKCNIMNSNATSMQLNNHWSRFVQHISQVRRHEYPGSSRHFSLFRRSRFHWLGVTGKPLWVFAHTAIVFHCKVTVMSW